jgi:hypothetical protein
MLTARAGKQLLVEAPERIGMLAKVSKAIADAGVNIIAVNAFVREGKAHFMLLTSNNAEATVALKPLNIDIKEEDVVLVDLGDQVGSAGEMGEKLANARINLSYIYGTTSAAGSTCLLVLVSNNNAKAIEVINK